jgi:hypothetical protein
MNQLTKISDEDVKLWGVFAPMSRFLIEMNAIEFEQFQELTTQGTANTFIYRRKHFHSRLHHSLGRSGFLVLTILL